MTDTIDDGEYRIEIRGDDSEDFPATDSYPITD